MKTLSDCEIGNPKALDEHVYKASDISDFLHVLKTKIISEQGVSDYVLNGNAAVEIIDELAGNKFAQGQISESGGKQ